MTDTAETIRTVDTNVRLIGCDIDGTLLRYDSSVSPRTLGAIALASSAGVPVCLVTGRRVESTLRVASQLGLATPCVTHCGAAIIDPVNDTIIHATHIGRGLAVSVCELAGRAGASVAVYQNLRRDRGIVVTGARELEHAAKHWPSLAQVCRVAGSYEQACMWDPLQITVFGQLESVRQFLAELKSRHGGEVFSVDYGAAEGGTALADVLAAGVNKGAGLAFVAEMFDVPQSQVAAFGDSVNDFEMLAYAGLPVAMANADDDLKALATVIAPSCNEDGVARIIEALAHQGLLGEPDSAAPQAKERSPHDAVSERRR